jgi:hypothetical protein
VYLIGDFTTVNGVARQRPGGLERRDGSLTWGAGFDPQGRAASLAVSSIGVYVAGLRVVRPAAALGLRRLEWPRAVREELQPDRRWRLPRRVYVGGGGYQRPLGRSIILTGDDDTSWQPDMQFQLVSGTYGDYTSINAMLLDGGRLTSAGDS